MTYRPEEHKTFKLRNDIPGIILVIVLGLVLLPGCATYARHAERKVVWKQVELHWYKMEYQLVTGPCTEGWRIANETKHRLKKELFGKE